MTTAAIRQKINEQFLNKSFTALDFQDVATNPYERLRKLEIRGEIEQVGTTRSPTNRKPMRVYKATGKAIDAFETPPKRGRKKSSTLLEECWPMN